MEDAGLPPEPDTPEPWTLQWFHVEQDLNAEAGEVAISDAAVDAAFERLRVPITDRRFARHAILICAGARSEARFERLADEEDRRQQERAAKQR